MRMTDQNDQSVVTVARALRTARARLTDAGLETPGLDAEVLLRHVLGWDRTQILSRPGHELAEDDVNRYERLLSQRVKGAPVLVRISAPLSAASMSSCSTVPLLL